MTFIVVKKGVYRHNIVGFRETLEEATALAREAILKEPDDHHGFEVVQVFPEGENVLRVLRRDRKPRYGSGPIVYEYRWDDEDGKTIEEIGTTF